MLFRSLMLGLDEEFAPVFSGGQVDAATVKKFDKLLGGFNLCISEIGSDYIPLLVSQTMTTTNGKLIIANNDAKSIREIRTIGGKKLKFKLFEGYVLVDFDGIVEVISVAIPSKLTLNSEFNAFAGRVSEKCLAIGTAAEFCFMSALFDDAAIWDNRFRQALKCSCFKKDSLILPRRRWL